MYLLNCVQQSLVDSIVLVPKLNGQCHYVYIETNALLNNISIEAKLHLSDVPCTLLSHF